MGKDGTRQALFVYGAGACAEACYDHLVSAGVSVAGFFDTFKDGTCRGIPVRRFSAAEAHELNEASVVIASMHWLEILSVLAASGVHSASMFSLAGHRVIGPFAIGRSLPEILRIQELVEPLRDSILPFLRSRSERGLISTTDQAAAFDVLFTEPDYAAIRVHAVKQWSDHCANRRRLTSRPERRLVIYDSAFPSPLATAVWEEYLAYLHEIPACTIHASGSDFPPPHTHEARLALFSDLFRKHPIAMGKVQPFTTAFHLDRNALFYCIFLRTIFQFIDQLEAFETPFAFTLYSGGEFGLGNERSDHMLRRVCSSPCFRKVIVAQFPTYEYLLERRIAAPGTIEHIYGPVSRVDYVSRNCREKLFFPHGKPTFDICFIANRSPTLPRGENKGYDTFIEVIRILTRQDSRVRGHVFGHWDEHLVPMDEFRDRVTFYGPQPLDVLLNHYRGFDIVLSPSRPNVLAPGDLDGAPNVATVEAGAAGLAVFITDQLRQCRKYETGEHLEIVTEDPHAIAARISRYLHHPTELYALAARGAERFRQNHGYASQLRPRIKLLNQLLHE